MAGRLQKQDKPEDLPDHIVYSVLGEKNRKLTVLCTRIFYFPVFYFSACWPLYLLSLLAELFRWLRH